MKKLVSTMFYDSLTAIIFAAIAGTIGMVVDGILIGYCLGEGSMAAFGIASPVFLVLYALGGVLSSGMQAKCAEMIGTGDMKKSNDFFSLSITLSTLLSVVLMAIFMFFSVPISQFLGASGKTAYLLNDTKMYILGLSFGIPVIIVSQCMQNSMQLDGDKTRIFIATLVTTISDIIADLINVYVIHGGMFGMAVATTISYYLGFVVYMLHFRKDNIIFHYSLKKTNWRLSQELISTGLPTAIGRFSTTLRIFILNNLLLAISGAAAVTALSTQTNINNFFSSVSVGISMTVLMISGIFYGEENHSEMKALLATSIKACVTIVSALGIIIFATAPFLAKMYIQEDSESFLICVSSIRYLAISMPLHAMCNVFINYLQGSKNLKLSHITCLFNELVMVVICAIVFGNLFGAVGVWLAFPLGKLLTLVSVVVMACIHQRKMVKGLDDMLFLPKDFDKESIYGNTLSIDISENFAYPIETLYAFCKKTGMNSTQIENIQYIFETIISHLSSSGTKAGTVAFVRLIKKKDAFVIRYRDNIRKAAAPTEWKEFSKLSDITKTFQHNNVMGTNSLYIELK